MNWFKENLGWFIACFISFMAGSLFVLWLKSSGSQTVTLNPAIDRPAPVQPVFVHDTTVIYRLGGSIGVAEPKLMALDTLAKTVPIAQTDTLCPPFTLHLISSDETPKSFGLDSVVTFYRWPPGDHYFAYYGYPQKRNSIQESGRFPLLSYGVEANYYLYRAQINFSPFLQIRLHSLSIQGGYRMEAEQHPRWFVGVRRDWRIF